MTYSLFLFSAPSTGMLDNLTNQLTILDISPELLRQGAFPVVIVVGLGRQIYVDAATFAGEDFRV